MTTAPTFPTIEVRELHGRTPKGLINRLFTFPHLARPGDIIATREVGRLHEASFLGGGPRFVIRALSGFHELRLSDLPEHLMEEAALCVATIMDDWEIYQELDQYEPYLRKDRPGNRVLEVFRFRDALGLLRLPKYRLLSTQPSNGIAALFIEDPSSFGNPPLPAERLRGIKSAWSQLSGAGPI